MECPERAVLASARPCGGEGKVVLSTSFLFWQGKLWGLEFSAKSFLGNVPGSSEQTFEQKLFVPDFAWRPGVKVKLGYNLCHDQWDLLGDWTYYHEECTSLKKHFNSQIVPEGLGVIPLWHYPFVEIVGGNEGNPLRFKSSSANWRMDFNSFDLELGRFFFPVQSLPMRFKVGAKGSLIRQFYHVDYDDGFPILAINPNTSETQIFEFPSSKFRVGTDQWGLGPRLGIESKWNFWRGFNLIGNGAFSVLCSFFDLKTVYDDILVPSVNSLFVMEEHFHELTPVCEAMVGIDWGTCFCNKFFFGFAMGYEWQYWWSMNHARRNYVQTLPGETFDMRGELQMQGLNAAIKLDF